MRMQMNDFSFLSLTCKVNNVNTDHVSVDVLLIMSICHMNMLHAT